MYNHFKASAPTTAGHPNAFAWFCLVSKFTDAVRATWGAAAAGKGGKADKKGAKKEEKKAETKKADDDMDLFGDDDDDVSASNCY
jgi:hypothetical protein